MIANSPTDIPLEDIHSRKQIQLLVDLFYLQARQDELLGPVFNRAIENWQQHLPRMYQFWEKLLFGTEGYSGNPFQKHLALHLGAEHFEAWLRIFNNTVQENFAGVKAEQAKNYARNISNTFQLKMGIKREHSLP